jgi:hypothetical protein
LNKKRKNSFNSIWYFIIIFNYFLL